MLGLIIWIFVAAGAEALTLEGAVELALARNEAIEEARLDRLRAREEIREGWAEALPEITVRGNYDRSWLLPSFVFDTPQGQQTFSIGTSNTITGVLSVRQVLWSSGKVGAGLQAARAFRSLTESGHLLAKQMVAAEAEVAFSNVLLAESLVEVSREALTQARANLDQVTSLRKAGRVSDYDLLRATVRVTALRPDSIRAAHGRAVALLDLKDVIGVPPTEKIVPDGTFRNKTPLDLDDPSALVSQALGGRPDLVQAGFEVTMREAAIRAQKSEMRPSLDLVATGQLQAQSNTFEFAGDDFVQSWVTGVALNLPLFDGTRNRALVNKAKVERRRSEVAVTRLEKRVRRDVRQAWYDVQEARERVDAQEDIRTEAERNAELATSRYGIGFGTQLEVLDAQVVLTRSRSDLVLARFDLARALVGLEQAVGISPFVEVEAGGRE